MDHGTSDEQSWRLTRAAVDVLLARPELAATALATLDRWDSVVPPDSAALRQQRDALIRRDFAPVLARNDRGHSSAGASPLARVLPQAQRLAIIRGMQRSQLEHLIPRRWRDHEPVRVRRHRQPGHPRIRRGSRPPSACLDGGRTSIRFRRPSWPT